MFFLLLTQQVAMSHAVTHLAPAALASAAGEERVGGPADFKLHVCDLCAAAQHATAPPSAEVCLRLPASVALVRIDARECAARSALRLAFRSRAPPPL